MPSYRCYFVGADGHITAAENVDADALSDAVDKALAMLKARPHHRSIEIWDGAKKLYPSEPLP